MAEQLLLHPKTSQQVGQIIKSPPQSLLIYGPAGSNKLGLAKAIVSEILEIEAEQLANYPYFMLIQKPAAKQEIPIEMVRSAITQLRLKAVKNEARAVSRIILIDDVHQASAEAQNALLKAIEEPPAQTIFIMTALSPTAVLPTIASRTEKIPVIPIGLDGARRHYLNQYDAGTIDSAWQLSGGFAGLLDALLKDDAAHPLKQSVETAKQLLRARRYERILLLDEISTNKSDFKNTLAALSRILGALHQAAIKTDNLSQAKRIVAARKVVIAAARRLEKNTSPKLIALDIALRLPV